MNIKYFLIIQVTTASSILATSAPHDPHLHNPRINQKFVVINFTEPNHQVNSQNAQTELL